MSKEWRNMIEDGVMQEDLRNKVIKPAIALALDSPSILRERDYTNIEVVSLDLRRMTRDAFVDILTHGGIARRCASDVYPDIYSEAIQMLCWTWGRFVVAGKTYLVSQDGKVRPCINQMGDETIDVLFYSGKVDGEWLFLDAAPCFGEPGEHYSQSCAISSLFSRIGKTVTDIKPNPEMTILAYPSDRFACLDSVEGGSADLSAFVADGTVSQTCYVNDWLASIKRPSLTVTA